MQLSQQESSKRAQGEELERLRVQLETLKKEEREYKQKVRDREKNMSPVLPQSFVRACILLFSNLKTVRVRARGYSFPCSSTGHPSKKTGVKHYLCMYIHELNHNSLSCEQL